MEQANKCSASQEATTTETPKIDNNAVTILRKSRVPGGRSNSIVVFGVDFEVTKNLQWRVVCAQRLAALFSLMMIFAFGFQNNQLYRICSICFLCSLILFYYNNISYVTLKRLFRESNIIILISFSVLNAAIEIFVPTDAWSWYHGLCYACITIAMIVNDSAILNTRPFILVLMLVFILMTSYNIYARIFLNLDLGVIWIEYKVRGESFTIEKRSAQRTIFAQLLIASLQGVWTMVHDKNMELMMFVYGPIYKDSGKSSPSNSSQRGQRQKRRGGNRNSWNESFRRLKTRFRESVAIPKSGSVMGIKREVDEALERRLSLCQNGIMISTLISVLLFVLSSIDEGLGPNLRLASVVCGSPAVVFFVILSYGNISLAVIKRLLHELNVLAIIGLSICLILAEVFRPINPYSAVFAVLFTLIVLIFVMFDAVISKSRLFLLFFITITLGLLLHNIYQTVFGTTNKGIILVKYDIGKEQGTIRKRFLLFSIYTQTLLFSFKGLCNAFEDREMKLLIFATGNVYKSTGTASRYSVDGSYSIHRSEELKNIGSLRDPEKKVSVI